MVKYENPLQEKKQHIFRERETGWKNKVLHGKWVETIKNTAETSEWLRTAHLRPTTEALITAARDQALNTNWHSCHIFKTKQTDKCRRCSEHPETVNYFISGCPKLAQTVYLERHNAVASTIYWSLTKELNFERADHWWEHKPESVLENDVYKLYMTLISYADKKITVRRPDIVIVNKGQRKTTLIDIA